MNSAHTFKQRDSFEGRSLHTSPLGWIKFFHPVVLFSISLFGIIPVHGREYHPIDSTEFACPVLVITDPLPVCQPGSVNLGAATVTSGSSLTDATLTYWVDAAATIAVANPTSVTTSGTYYIKATTLDPCSDIKPVVVTVNPSPTVTVNSPAFCTSSATSATLIATPVPTGTYSYTWTVPGAVTDPGDVQSFSTSTGGTYSVFIKNPTTGCTSQIASGTVTGSTPPVITIQPGNNMICSNNTAAFFNADADGTPAPSVQWQISTNNGSTWSDLAGTTTKSFTFNPQPSENGQMYRAVFTNACGSAITNSGTLIVGQGVNFPKDLNGQVSCNGGVPLSTKITGGVGLVGILTFFLGTQRRQ